MARIAGPVIALVTAVTLALPINAVTPPPRQVVSPVEPDTRTAQKIAPQLARAQGTIEVVIQLTQAPLALAAGPNSKQLGARLPASAQRAYVSQLGTAQTRLMDQIASLGGREIARVTKALNAVIVSVDAAKVGAIAALPDVKSVRPVVNYQVALSDTVPYIGGTALHTQGITGTGVTVAVIDSGIDYTHYNLFGSGTITDYRAAYGTLLTSTQNTTIPVGLFPTAKVVGGYDFVGELWPVYTTTLHPDPNPIAAPEGPDPFDGGHGTHVSDIIGGRLGVAPGAKLLALKACSSVSSSCSGVALLQAMDFALDPNGDDNISDAVDVINMSLGSDFGQLEDDLSYASANAVAAGVVVVTAAGNAADRPYIASSPSIEPSVISVAQTQVPSAKTFPLVINAPLSIAGHYSNTATVEWAPLDGGFSGDVVYVGRACPADDAAGTPADPLLADPKGKVALIDRGVCSISLKVDRAVISGSIGVLVANNRSGDAPSFSFGGGDHMTPTLIIRQNEGNLIRSVMPTSTVKVTVSPATFVNLVGSMASTSARGPSGSYNAIKPDIGAPGASVSAVSGHGTEVAAFGGTSGATPMVAGSAALLLSGQPGLKPAEVKALLMNTAETEIFTNPATQPGELAPITRIGGGEVRVNRAYAATTGAWATGEFSDTNVSLSFGYHAVSANVSFTKTVKVHNYTGTTRTYVITPTFRYADDEASGAVAVTAPPTITVGPNGNATFDVRLDIVASKLPTWTLNGGARGGDGFRLQGVEFDGYLYIADATDNIHLPWQVLPHKAAVVTPSTTTPALGTSGAVVTLTNASTAYPGWVDVFALTGVSPNQNFVPVLGSNETVVDLHYVGVRDDGTFLEFAINTYGTRAHPVYPAEFDIYIDTNVDGQWDFVLFNTENGGFGATGQDLVNLYDFATDTTTPMYYADADLDSGNMIFPMDLASLGLAANQKFRFSVNAYDNYFTGFRTDAVTNMYYTVGKPRFSASSLEVPAGSSSPLAIHRGPGNYGTAQSQTGMLLMYRDAAPGKEADAIMFDLVEKFVYLPLVKR